MAADMISFAQNFEDVMLERLFSSKRRGFYVDVGAWDPNHYSVTRHFYRRGWRGLNVEPIAWRHAMFLKERPRDINLHGLVGIGPATANFFECVEEDYLSTTVASVADKLRDGGREIKEYEVGVRPLDELIERYCPKAIDFLKLDVEGAEAEILKTIDLHRHRPRALVIEATLPGSGLKSWDEPEANGSWNEWEAGVLDAGYAFALFDGLNRFYLRREDQRLARRLVLPPGIFDGIDCSQGPQNEAAERLDVINRQQIEMEALRAHRATADGMIAQFAASGAAADALLATCTSRIEALEAERSARDRDIQELEEQLAARQDALEQSLHAVADVTGELDEARSHQAALAHAGTARLGDLEAERIAREQVIAELRRHLEEREHDCTRGSETIHQLTAELAEERGRSADLARQAVAAEADRLSQRETTEACQRRIAELDLQVDERRVAIERITAEIEEARGRHLKLADAAHARIELLEAGSLKREEAIDGLRDQLAAAAVERASRQDALARLVAQLSDSRERCTELIKTYATRIDLLQGDRCARDEVIHALERQLADAERQSEDRRAAIMRLEAELHEEIISKADLAQTSHLRIEALEADSAARETNIAGLRDQLGRAGAESVDRLHAIARLEDKLAAETEHHGAVRSAMVARIEVLEADRAVRMTVIDELQAQAAELARDGADRLEMIEALTVEIDHVRTDYAAAQLAHAEHVKTLEGDRQARGDVIEQTRDQLETLQRDWNERGCLIEALDRSLTHSRRAAASLEATIADQHAEIALGRATLAGLARQAAELDRLAATRLDLLAVGEAHVASLDQQLASALLEIDELKRRWATRLKTYFTGHK